MTTSEIDLLRQRLRNQKTPSQTRAIGAAARLFGRFLNADVTLSM